MGKGDGLRQLIASLLENMEYTALRDVSSFF